MGESISSAPRRAEQVNRSLPSEGIELTRGLSAEGAEILTPDAMRFLAELSRAFEPTRQDILEQRQQRQAEIDAGKMPDFLPETRAVREADWRVAPIPPDLLDRRVEITGPVDRKMIINALNSGASVFMADFEDSNAPTWANVIEGQVNLKSAVEGTLRFRSPEGKDYALGDRLATLMVRPRGWHLPEKHMLVDGKAISGSLFDFGLFFFHNAAKLIEKKTGPYFYLPKLENYLEARLWNDVFILAQDRLGIPRGTIRATVLIETILGGFEMDEILFELKEHSAGLNCGRWDYIFSFIKKFRNRADFVLPERAQVTMDRAFLKAYVDLLIQTCHKRGIHAMGGMAAQIPIKNDPVANDTALERVRQDKRREVAAGHDGTWVAHPALVPIAKAIFDEQMPGANQIHLTRAEVRIAADDLLSLPEGDITEMGLRTNIRVGIQYLEAWLRGLGCVPLYNLMEDAATAEISRSQVWQWVRHGAKLADGRPITSELVKQIMSEELRSVQQAIGVRAYESGKMEPAAKIFGRIMTSEFPEFMTSIAYAEID